MRFPPLLLATVLLGGCSIQPIQKQDEERPSLAHSTQQAELLRKQKQYSKSENLLIQAIQHYPNNSKLQLLLEQIQTERQHHKQRLKINFWLLSSHSSSSNVLCLKQSSQERNRRSDDQFPAASVGKEMAGEPTITPPLVESVS